MKNFFKASGIILLYLLVYFILSNNLGSFFYLFYIVRDVIQDPAIVSNGVLTSRLMDYLELITQASLIIQMISAVISFFFYWMIIRIRKKNFFEEMSFHKTKPSNLFISAVLGISLLLPITILVSVLKIDKLSPDTQKTMENIMKGNSIFVIFLVIGIVAPIIEEIIFRGLIFSELRRRVNIRLAIVIQAVLFGLYHLNLTQAIYASVLGLVLGYVCYKTGSLFASILVHMFFNTTSLVVDKIVSNFDMQIVNGKPTAQQAAFSVASVSFVLLSIFLIFISFTVLHLINKHHESSQ